MRIRTSVPASSANLGPGFDTLAVALDLQLVAELETNRSDRLCVVEGPDLDGGDNLVVTGIRTACQAAGRNLPAGSLRICSPIPVARGLGSSAAALVAGLLLGNKLCGDSLDSDTLLRLAMDVEGHGDNVAAALFGGFVIVANDADDAVWRRIPTAGNLRAVVYVPEQFGLTRVARAVVPETVSRSDAVENAAHLGMLVLALATGEFALLRAAMQDRLHQPYRATLYPYLPDMIASAVAAGAYGASLSGAGPSVITLVASDREAEVRSALSAVAKSRDLAGKVCCLDIAQEGGRVRKLPD